LGGLATRGIDAGLEVEFRVLASAFC